MVYIFLIGLLVTGSVFASLEKQFFTVFYQGMFNSQIQASKYVGPQGFYYKHTGEKIYCPSAIESIINLSPQPEIDEIELFDTKISPLRYVFRPVTSVWFVATRISRWWSNIYVEPIGAQKDIRESIKTYAIKIHKMNLGQEGDIAEHKKRVDRCSAEHPDAEVVVYGVSRGSITSFNAHALYQYENVKALVLEGCPDSISNVVREAQGTLLHYLYTVGVQYVCAHNPLGISALSLVEQFPRKTPVLFITSLKDQVVPSNCTLRLVKALKESGHQHTYCLVLKNSSHIGYTVDDPNDAQNYQNVVHAFYKKCGIAGYNNTYACAGEALLEQCHQL